MFNLIILVGSVLMLFVTWAFCSCLPGNELENTFIFTVTSYNFWLVILFIIGIAIGDYSISKLTDNTYYAPYIPPLTLESNSIGDASDYLDAGIEVNYANLQKKQESSVKVKPVEESKEVELEGQEEKTVDNENVRRSSKRSSEPTNEFADKL